MTFVSLFLENKPKNLSTLKNSFQKRFYVVAIGVPKDLGSYLSPLLLHSQIVG